MRSAGIHCSHIRPHNLSHELQIWAIFIFEAKFISLHMSWGRIRFWFMRRSKFLGRIKFGWSLAKGKFLDGVEIRADFFRWSYFLRVVSPAAKNDFCVYCENAGSSSASLSRECEETKGICCCPDYGNRCLYSFGLYFYLYMCLKYRQYCAMIANFTIGRQFWDSYGLNLYHYWTIGDIYGYNYARFVPVLRVVKILRIQVVFFQ